MDRETIGKFKYLVNKNKSLQEICTILDKQVYEIYELIAFLNELDGDYIIEGNNVFKARKCSSFQHNFPFLDKTKICLVSDPHYGSNFDRPDIMQTIYKECLARDTDTIFCAGDFTNGYYKRRNFYDSRVSTLEQMIDYVANVHPYSKYINFFTIGGNHDATFKLTYGVDIIEEIAKVRSDIIYLGQDMADITMGSLSLRIYHGYGKEKRSIERRVTKCYDKMRFVNPPDILHMGHIHHSLYMPINGTHVFQTAALVDPIQESYNNSYPFERSCWFLSLKYDDDGSLESVVPEYMSFGPKRVRKK